MFMTAGLAVNEDWLRPIQ